MQETQVQSLGREASLEGEMETSSNILAWKILCVVRKESDTTEHIGIAWHLTVVGSVHGPFLVGKEPGSQSDPGQQATQRAQWTGDPLKEMHSFYKYLLSSYYVSFLWNYHLQYIISVNPSNIPVLFYCFIIIPIWWIRKLELRKVKLNLNPARNVLILSAEWKE